MIRPSSTNGERRECTSFAQDPLQLIHAALLWANWSRALPACVLLIHPTQFKCSCSQRSQCVCVCVRACVCVRVCWGGGMYFTEELFLGFFLNDPQQKSISQTCVICSLSYFICLLWLSDDSEPGKSIRIPFVAKFKYMGKSEGTLCLIFCLQCVLYII